MPTKRIKNNANNIQVGSNKQRRKKPSLSTNAAHEVNNNEIISTSKRFKVVLTCVICNGDAHGYNFDAISCESCKAFFRRNALRPIEKFKCRGNGHCNVKFSIKTRCKKCRLEKCIQSGMRKEWILSDKEKEEKRAKIEANRCLKQMNDNTQEREQSIKQASKIDGDLSLDFSSFLNQKFLTDFDWANIQSIQDRFNGAVKLNQIAGISSYPSIQSIESTSELFRVPIYISAMRLIRFIKQINEFHQLNEQEQIHLVKLNLLQTCFFHSIFIYDPRTDCYHEQDTTDPLFSGKDWIQTLNKEFHSEMKNLRNEILDIFQMDNVIIKLFYVILFFSQQMSLSQTKQYSLPDIQPFNIFKAQNVFTDLVYQYCLQQYGSSKAPILFTRYIMKIMKLQQLVDEIKYTIHNYVDVTQLAPLTRSILL